nr:lysophospholipid acyltransferase family protein [uncultured Sphingomonas sp.]
MTAKAEPAAAPSRRWRAYLRIAGLAGLLLLCVPPHVLSKALTGGQSDWPRRFLRGVAWVTGVRPTVEGAVVGPHSFLIANHVSWLDIIVMAATTGTAFVSKAEIKASPLIGWLADQNNTVYVDRSDRGGVADQIRDIAAELKTAQPLTVFPEGTTSNGRELLPFRTTLLHAVAPPPPGAVVRPVVLDYGAAVDGIVWIGGEPGIANALRVLGRKGTLPVTVRLLPPLPPTDNRKHLAKAARDAIEVALSSLRSGSAL